MVALTPTSIKKLQLFMVSSLSQLLRKMPRNSYCRQTYELQNNSIHNWPIVIENSSVILKQCWYENQSHLNCRKSMHSNPNMFSKFLVRNLRQEWQFMNWRLAAYTYLVRQLQWHQQSRLWESNAKKSQFK